jgi:hypothetical protein
MLHRPLIRPGKKAEGGTTRFDRAYTDARQILMCRVNQ